MTVRLIYRAQGAFWLGRFSASVFGSRVFKTRAANPPDPRASARLSRTAAQTERTAHRTLRTDRDAAT